MIYLIYRFRIKKAKSYRHSGKVLSRQKQKRTSYRESYRIRWLFLY
nr:MAG TPA: hypothetical protein [Caudoviricetes sp.]